MLKLYDNAFSPFARKVRLVLEHKGLVHETVDGLALANRELLEKVNGRVEVPALDHDGLVVVGSADICLYLERLRHEPSIYPSDHAEWVRARAWERCADTTIDPILINLSYWSWAERDDQLPAAWVEAARKDLEVVYAALERDLESRHFVCGQLSIAELALFPHLTATRFYGVGHDPERHPRLHAWLKRLRTMDVFAADLERTKSFMKEFTTRVLATEVPDGSGLRARGREGPEGRAVQFAAATTHERKKIFWRGDRLEWVLARGFHRWLAKEIEEDRVIFPGVGVPGPRSV